ncbi:MAG: glucosamine-6-phosphate isomerase [Bacteroidetes bacterium]|nr:MAG: glucosamine-6-phosphate isomerase [Bacteroidota bacterium]
MLKTTNFSSVEKVFFENSGMKTMQSRMPYVVVDNFPRLGLFTALRFIEWIAENPDGVISLPTGKTPEHFIKWTSYFLNNWESEKTRGLFKQYGIAHLKKPETKGLHFVQIDEFYPIHSWQHNSFYYYVNKFYIDGFGLDPEKALFINSNEIPLAGGKPFTDIFPDLKVDLSLRFRDPKNSVERKQQESIYLIDHWCSEYERKIRDMGGIGFFLGGIGPDGHIAFNTRGSDHFSNTRLTATNFETQAVAAGDLGGISVSKNRLVITIGLDTIAYKKEAVAIIIAAGEAKADVVKNALEKEPSNLYPATVLHQLPNARFYITRGAAVGLKDSIDRYYTTGEWTKEKTERAIIDLCVQSETYAHHLTEEDLKNDPYTRLIPDVSLKTVETVIEQVKSKIALGMKHCQNEIFYHTGPHHDDIMLGLLPNVSHQLREASNSFYFTVMTSGFTAVTNKFMIESLKDTLYFLLKDQIQMVHYLDFYRDGYKLKRDKDVYHYLNKVASGEPGERKRGLSHRVVRSIIEVYEIKNTLDLKEKIHDIIHKLENSYDGEKNPPDIQKLKGMIREFEEELVWAHFGVRVSNVNHLRLGFYTGDIFTAQPERNRDVLPILEELRKYKPTTISLAFDPEGSGPDTHYKVLQAIAEAVRLWGKEEDLSHLKIIGYRNVWFKFHPAEATNFVPVSLNSLSVLDSAFTDCYLSQVEAPFPSYMLDGKFSTLAEKIWIGQLKDIQLVLGKNYFYENESPRIRATHGMLYFKQMDVNTFLAHARELEKSMEGVE